MEGNCDLKPNLKCRDCGRGWHVQGTDDDKANEKCPQCGSESIEDLTLESLNVSCGENENIHLGGK